jgi:hypothetical protein
VPGSGKSSLTDLLAGRQDVERFQGSGERRPERDVVVDEIVGPIDLDEVASDESSHRVADECDANVVAVGQRVEALLER